MDSASGFHFKTAWPPSIGIMGYQTVTSTAMGIKHYTVLGIFHI